MVFFSPPSQSPIEYPKICVNHIPTTVTGIDKDNRVLQPGFDPSTSWIRDLRVTALPTCSAKSYWSAQYYQLLKESSADGVKTPTQYFALSSCPHKQFKYRIPILQERFLHPIFFLQILYTFPVSSIPNEGTVTCNLAAITVRMLYGVSSAYTISQDM